MNIDWEGFGVRLITAREIAGLTQEEAAHELNITRKSLGNHEKGQKPKPGMPNKYAATYKVNLLWLLTGEGEPRPRLRGFADQSGLYGKSKLIEKAGKTYALTEYDPEETAPDDLSTIDRLVEMLSRRDSENALLKARNQELERQLRSIIRLVLDHKRGPQEERRAVMKQISDLIDGNELLKKG